MEFSDSPNIHSTLDPMHDTEMDTVTALQEPAVQLRIKWDAEQEVCGFEKR